MGWTFGSNTTRKQIIQERTALWDNKNNSNNTKDHYVSFVCLKNCFKGSSVAGTLWTVWEITHFNKLDDSVIKTERFIGCDLLRYSNYRNSHSWGYKDMDESMGPYIYNCPLSYLPMVPCPGGCAEEWRKGVLEHHRIRQEKLKAKRAKAKGIYTPSSYFL